MRAGNRGARKFFKSHALTLYPENLLYEEAAFIAYYAHWSHEEIMNLPHRERGRWCKEFSKINRKLNDEPENVFDVT